jgi:ribosomal protein S27AE
MSNSTTTKKVSKKNVTDSRTTLDAIHQAHVKTFINTDDELADIIAQLQQIDTQLEVCPSEEKIDLHRQKDTLLKRRSQLQSKDDLMNYYLQTGNLLFEYYEIQDKISTGAALTNNMKSRPGTVFAALEAAATSDTVPAQAKSSPSSKNTSFDREKLLDKYLQVVNPEMARNITNEINDNWSECPNCTTEMIFCMNEAYVSCPKCGYQTNILIDSDKPSYKDPPREISYYAYKRINHFNEWLAQFQAKESTEIPQEIFDGILLELKKERITDMSSLKVSKLREILRKLKFNKYYEHIPHILNRLNGQSAPVMSRDNEEKLRHMFKEIQPSFQKHCPAERSNFLSYSYVLYKFCELLELDEFLPCFPLLKNRDKLYAQDKIWEKICADLRWAFIRTI